MIENADPDARFLEVFERTSEFEPGQRQYAAYRSFNLSAVERGRRVVERLKEEIRLDGSRALDIGAGSGGMAIALAEAGALVEALEPDSIRLLWASERVAGHGVAVRLHSTAAERLDFADSTFDLVVLDSVIEHVEDPTQVVRETTRVLRPGGLVYLVSPNKASLFNILRDPHYDLFGVVLLPRPVGKFYVERVRRVRRGYWVNVIPTKRWLVRELGRGGVRVTQVVPDGFEKLAMRGAPFRGSRLLRMVAQAATRLRMQGILSRVALAQYPTFILLGRKSEGRRRLSVSTPERNAPER